MKINDEAGNRLEERAKRQLGLTVSRLELLIASIDESQEASVWQVREDALRMYAACRRALLWAALEKGTLTFEKTPMGVTDLLGGIWKNAERALRGRKVELTLDVPKGLYVVCDARAVEYILLCSLSARAAAGVRSAALCAVPYADTVRFCLSGGRADSPDAREREALALALAERHGCRPETDETSAFSFSLEKVPVETLHSDVPMPVIDSISQAEIELAGL